MTSKKDTSNVVRCLLPAIVPIAGKDYTIKFNTKINGAHFEVRKQLIEINPHMSKSEFISALLHEVLEVIYTERLYRFTKEKYPLDNGDYLFVMNHDSFEKSVNDLAYAVTKIFNL